MDCDTASGLLPWLLNGTLDAAEADAVRGHVAGCARCRREAEETRRAAAVFAAHPSASQIVDLAWDRPVTDGDLVRRHVGSCEECADELSLAEESRRAEVVPAAAAPARPVARRGWIALPAAMAAGLVVGLLWPRAPATSDLDLRVAALQSEVGRLRASLGDLQARAERLAAPELNLPVFELVASTLTRGPADAAANEIAIPRGARQVALLLVADHDGPARLEIRRADGASVWSADGLAASPLGAYSLAVPAALLADGRYVLALTPAGGRPVEYRVRVRAVP